MLSIRASTSADLYDSFCSEVLADRTLFDVFEDGATVCRAAGGADATALNHLTSIGRVLAKAATGRLGRASGRRDSCGMFYARATMPSLSTIEKALDTLGWLRSDARLQLARLAPSPVHEYEYPLTLDLFTNDSNDAETAVTDDNKHEAVDWAASISSYDCRRSAFDALRAGFAVG